MQSEDIKRLFHKNLDLLGQTAGVELDRDDHARFEFNLEQFGFEAANLALYDLIDEQCAGEPIPSIYTLQKRTVKKLRVNMGAKTNDP